MTSKTDTKDDTKDAAPPALTPIAETANVFGLSPAQSSQLETAIVVAQGIAPMLPKNAQLALTLGTVLYSAVQQAAATGADLSDADLAALFQADAAAKVADAVMRASLPPEQPPA